MTKLDTLLLELEKLDRERTQTDGTISRVMDGDLAISHHLHTEEDGEIIVDFYTEQDARFYSAAVNSNKVLREVINIQREALEFYEDGHSKVVEGHKWDAVCKRCNDRGELARQALEAAEKVCEEKG